MGLGSLDLVFVVNCLTIVIEDCTWMINDYVNSRRYNPHL